MGHLRSPRIDKSCAANGAMLSKGMVREPQSCLVSRLSRFVTLTDPECDFIAQMEQDEQARPKGHTIIRVGDQTDGIIVLKSGWAVVKADSADGRSQILRIYLPGEVIGMAELGSKQAAHRVVMQTSGTICPFPRTGLAPLITDYPRLAALLIAVGSLDQLALRHQAACLGSLDAARNLKFFLLQLRSRLDVANVGLGNQFQVPFSQVEIGQAVGLTSVYVNKLLRSFIAAGELEIERPNYRLLARETWETEIAYVNPFDDMDTSWFPPPAQTQPSERAPAAGPATV